VVIGLVIGFLGKVITRDKDKLDQGGIPMRKKLKGIDLELVKGDIAAQEDIEAVVNAANAQLKIGGGVAGAIHRAAGPELEKACRSKAPIQPGEAVITDAFNLPNDYVIHVLGPVYGRDKPEEKLLSNCYENALNLAEKNEIKSIAFPAISTGAFGYPIAEATEITLNTVNDHLDNLDSIKKIRFVLYGQSDFKVYKEKLNEIL